MISEKRHLLNRENFAVRYHLWSMEKSAVHENSKVISYKEALCLQEEISLCSSRI